MTYYLMRFAQWLAGRVPRPARLAIAGPLTTLVYFVWRRKRRVTIANMAQILGTTPRDPQAARLARLSWRNHGYYLSDLFYLPNASPAEILARGQDMTPAPGLTPLIGEALQGGKGLILVGAHFGAWDVAAVVVASQFPLSSVVESLPDPRMDKLLQDQRRQMGMEVLHIEKSPRPMLRVLQENKVLGVVLDRPVSPREGVPVTFFGRTCYVPAGVAQLSLRTGAPVIPGACWYDDAFSPAYYYAAGSILYPESTGDKRRDTIALMQRIYSALETFIRPRPEQWAMFRQFWPDQSPEARESASEEDVAARPTGASAALAGVSETRDVHEAGAYEA